MIRELKPYPAYRDSGVEWLGEVPEHWQVERLKARVANIDELARERRDSDLCIALEHVEGWTGRLREAGTEEVFDGQLKRFLAGDVLFGKLRPYLAKVTRSDRGGVCVGEFLVLRPRGAHLQGAYLEYLLRSKSIINVISSSVFGARMPRANWQFIGSMRLSVPPISEQSAIVRFLDQADRRSRRYIRAQQKLITLLNEQKQAIIHGAVTRGLDPDVPLKPSGVKWLGDVPEHWDVRPAKCLFREVDEPSATGEEELLSVSHITGVTPRSQKNINMFMASSNVGHKTCRPGDLVLNTMWAWMAALGVAREAGIVSPSYAVYRPLRGSRLLSDYVDLLLRTRPYVSEYLCRSTGIRLSRLRLYPEQFLRIRLVCPPQEEQQAILEWVAHETAPTERGIAGAQREISLLREYRARLIADVVTGKLDVREAATRLPVEAEEPDLLDDAGALAEDISEETEATDPDPALEEAEA